MFEQEMKQLTSELTVMQPTVLAKASQILNRNVDVLSLNAIIGGKNSTHAGVHKKSYSCFEEFFATWLDGMYKDYQNRAKEPYPMTKAGYRNALLLKDSDIMDYAEKFLLRNFLKNYSKRTTGISSATPNVAAWLPQISNFKQLFSKIVP